MTTESTKQLSALNDRDALILDLMSNGLTNREIEKQLGVAGELVKRYERNIIRKLAVRSRDQAIDLWKRSRAPCADQTKLRAQWQLSGKDAGFVNDRKWPLWRAFHNGQEPTLNSLTYTVCKTPARNPLP